MRTIGCEQVAGAVESLCIAACHELPDDVLHALERAARNESHSGAAKILHQLIENARIAARDRIPLCQDTGLAVVFVEQGAELAIGGPVARASGEGILPSRDAGILPAFPSGYEGETPSARADETSATLAPDGVGANTLVDAINEGVRAGYQNGYLRKSVVADPLHGRANTGTNTPAVIHLSIVPGERLRLTVMVKGGGCENKSQFRMFRPTADRQQIMDWIVEVVAQAGADACPPFVVGVGLGGDFEQCCLLSKKALLRELTQSHRDAFYADMERELLARINALGIGPQGLGGDTTALAVLLETAPCHIASLPVAVNIECHSHRHRTAVL